MCEGKEFELSCYPGSATIIIFTKDVKGKLKRFLTLTDQKEKLQALELLDTEWTSPDDIDLIAQSLIDGGV